MRGRQLFAALGILGAVFMTGSSAAAQTAQPKWYVMHQEFARPSMLKQYEETSKEFVSLVRQHHDASPLFNFVGVADDNFVYSYIGAIGSFNDLGAINAGFGALAQAAGEAKWADLMKRGGDAMEFSRESILMEDPSLSYTPAQPRLKPEEERYLHVDLYYVQPGREMEATATAKAIAELFRKKNMADRYRLFTVVMGPEMPLMIVVVPSKDPADYVARDAAVRQALGPEGQALFQRAFALTRRFESHNGWVRPDLSLEPMKPMQGK
jgi:hypothetical protein